MNIQEAFQAGMAVGACIGIAGTVITIAVIQFLESHTVVREYNDHPLVQPLDYPIDD